MMDINHMFGVPLMYIMTIYKNMYSLGSSLYSQDKSLGCENQILWDCVTAFSLQITSFDVLQTLLSNELINLGY